MKENQRCVISYTDDKGMFRQKNVVFLRYEFGLLHFKNESTGKEESYAPTRLDRIEVNGNTSEGHNGNKEARNETKNDKPF